MRRERGQALIEAVAALPVCVACALTVVDCGIEVRDRIATAQAATRAAEARLANENVADAAHGALPAQLRDDAQIDVDGGRVTVRTFGSSRLAALIGRRIEHRSSVEVPR